MNLTTCPDLSLDACAHRLDRLRAGVHDLGAGAAILHEPDVIRWAIGTTSPHGWPAALIVTDEAAIALLFGSGEPASIATDQTVMRGIRRDRPVRHHEELAVAASPWFATLGRSGKTVAIDVLGAPAWIASGLAAAGVKTTDLAGLLVRLRRRKDSDELAIIAHNVALAEVAYRAAEKAIRPGTTELAVCHAIIAAVETTAGTSVYFGGDFMAGPGGGETGGPPSPRVLAAGDSFVIDYFPRRGGYWADMCRTYPIGEPSPRLREAIRITTETLDLVEQVVRPGVPVADLDRALRVRQSAWSGGAGDYFHLSGHGIGMRPHEAPWIVSDSDEVFEAGDVIAVEPGVYFVELRGGVRIEDNFVVVDGGVRRLSQLPR